MPRFLPLFPLKLVVFPGERLKLRIFEPRYKQLINECISEGITFGIPSVIEGVAEEIATEMKLISIDREYGDGEMDILIKGIRRVRILEFFNKSENKLYPGGTVEKVMTYKEGDLPVQKNILILMNKLHEVLGIDNNNIKDPRKIFSYLIGHQIGLAIDQEYKLLSLDQETDRLKMIEDHLEAILPVVIEAERLKAKSRLNGHYKNIIPPQNL